MDKIKAIHYVLSELMRQYNEGIAVTNDYITELAIEYDIDNFVPELKAIAEKLMPVGSMGTVDYPFDDDVDLA
jgi:hypothetical protein